MSNFNTRLTYIIDTFKFFIRFSWISLLIVSIVYLLSTLNQGQTVLIDILDHNWINLLVFFVLLDGLANILSHYPIYIEKSVTQKRTNEDIFEWNVNAESPISNWLRNWLNIIFKYTGMGLVTFKIIGEDELEKNVLLKSLRKSLGLCLYLAILFLLVVTYEVIDLEEAKYRLSFLLVTIVILCCHFTFHSLQLPSRNINKYITCIYFLSWICRIVTITFSCLLGWSNITFYGFLITLFIEIANYSIYAKYRNSIIGRAKYLHFWLRGKDNLIYVLRSSILGWFSLGIVVYGHVYLFRVNSLVLILCYLILIYGMIIVPTKQFLYQSYIIKKPAEIKSKWHKFIFKANVNLFRAAPILILLWVIISSKIGNNLHSLPLKDTKTGSEIGIETFINHVNTYFAEQDTVYFISSYGGGLKANAWNLLLLDSLTNINGKNLLSQTVAMSGVSGGSLGQCLYAGLHKEYKNNPIVRKRKIDSIATSDFLSVDAAYFMGWDFIRENLPFNGINFPDRSGIAMKEYGDIVSPELYKKSFQEYWGEVFIQEIKDTSFYPMIISNSSATHLQRGIASTVNFKEDFNQIFHDAIDILNLKINGKQKSIPYLYAASCSNRFPIFSPTAKIKTKGHFLDGGYFENSGMSSLLDLYAYLREHSIICEKRAIFIQILNSKSDYVKWRIDNSLLENKKVKESGEIAAILKTAVSMDVFPRYVLKELQNNEQDSITFHQLHLPYPYNLNDVEDMFQGDISSRAISNYEEIRGKLDISNIEDKYNYIEPPLARILGDQAYAYMKIMVKYSGIDTLR